MCHQCVLPKKQWKTKDDDDDEEEMFSEFYCILGGGGWGGLVQLCFVIYFNLVHLCFMKTPGEMTNMIKPGITSTIYSESVKRKNHQR